VLSGAVVGVAFDCFRIIRRISHASDISTFLQDILFWILSSIIVFLFMLRFNAGEVRWYMYLGTFLGAFMYFLTISNYVIASIVWLIELIKKLLLLLFKIIMAPVKFVFKLVKKPFIIVFNLSKRGLKQFRYKILRNFKFFTKILKKI